MLLSDSSLVAARDGTQLPTIAPALYLTVLSVQVVAAIALALFTRGRLGWVESGSARIEEGKIMGFATTTSPQLRLADGRRLGYTEYGEPTGTPVVYFHGFPSSRLDWRLFHDQHVLAALNVRLIAPDRPGFGLSDFQRRRRLVDWPRDVVALADSLGIGRFSVLGISGGGPYAAACAAKLGERVHKTATVCGMGPADAPNVRDGASWSLPGMNPLMRGFTLWLTALGLKRDPAQFLERSKAILSVQDRELLENAELADLFIEGMVEAFRNGVKGANYEAGLYTHPWGFSLGEISTEVHLWHGGLDANVPLTIGRFMAEAIPGCHATFLEDEGHFTLPRNSLTEILRVLVS